jgi:hypothetical protein
VLFAGFTVKSFTHCSINKTPPHHSDISIPGTNNKYHTRSSASQIRERDTYGFAKNLHSLAAKYTYKKLRNIEMLVEKSSYSALKVGL